MCRLFWSKQLRWANKIKTAIKRLLFYGTVLLAIFLEWRRKDNRSFSSRCRTFKMQYPAIKVIPQKLKLPMNVFETFPECSLPSTVLKNNKTDRSPCSLKRCDGQSYPIYACTRANHARYMGVGPTYILRQLDAKFIIILGEKPDR